MHDTKGFMKSCTCSVGASTLGVSMVEPCAPCAPRGSLDCAGQPLGVVFKPCSNLDVPFSEHIESARVSDDEVEFIVRFAIRELLSSVGNLR